VYWSYPSPNVGVNATRGSYEREQAINWVAFQRERVNYTQVLIHPFNFLS